MSTLLAPITAMGCAFIGWPLLRAQGAAAAQLAIVAQGDELLDWHEMVARYPQAQLHLLEGSDHALSDFARHIDAVLAFLELARASAL